MRQINPDLINDIAERRTAIFIGAGVSAGVVTIGGQRIQTWSAFLSIAAAKVEDSKLKAHIIKVIAAKDYLMACKMISRGLGDQRWNELLIEEYSQRGTPSELQKIIMGLDQRIIITTNFDLHLESAWAEVNTKATHHPTVIKKISQDSFHAFRDSKRYIFKIHGSIDEPGSLIFTKKDYSEKAYGNWAYAKFIETILLTHTVLFVGFSLDDPAISQIIENYAHHLPNARPHYIFLEGSHSEKFIEINKELRKIFIIPYNKRDNHVELTELFRQITTAVDSRRRESSIATMIELDKKSSTGQQAEPSNDQAQIS